ncbi:MAG: hypothetical protein NUV60_02495 [Patescibacteria group bacterium]|nr:hypothetical protein [Patescibacteria group bacterium]
MNTNDVVGVLPMSPMHATKLGFYSIFAYAHLLSQSEQLPAVYGVNVCGKSGASDMMPKLRDSIELLNISPARWWVDSSIGDNAVSDEVGRLFEKGLVQEEGREVKRCSCGLVEYLGGVTLLGKGKTLIEGKYTECCRSLVSTSREKVLLTAPLPLVQAPETFPSWANKELQEVLKTLTGAQLLISRGTKRMFRVQLATGSSWELDNDLLWWLYLHWLQEEETSPRHLVVGASVVRQAGVLLAFSALLGIPLPKAIHCLPKVLFEPIHGVENLEQVVARFGAVRTANALVWSALSARKQCTLRGNVFPNMSTVVPAHVPIIQCRKLLWQN